jgi:hypothetical protein
MKAKKTNAQPGSGQVKQIAGLIETYCVEHVIFQDAAIFDEAGAIALDKLIERHMNELRDVQETRLPEDKQTLIEFHDRLQLRKARRMRRAFYASATEDKLADLVLGLLDEELDERNKAGLI